MGDSLRSNGSRLVLIFLCLLAACGPTPPIPATPPPTSVSSLPTARPVTPRPTLPPPVTTVLEPTPPPGGLVLWAVAGGPQLDALKRLIAELSQPIGVEVSVVGKSANGLQADIRANALVGLPQPDLIWGTQDDLGILQREGMLQPAGDGLDSAAFIPAVIAGATVGEQRWGTPLAAQGALLLLYNRRLVDAAPRTTDELIVRARQMTGGDHYGLVMAWAEPRWFVAWLNGFGGAALAPDGTPSLDTPQIVGALNLLKELRASGPPAPSTYDEGATLFRQGRVAFAVDGDWSLAGYAQYTDTLDLGIAPLPIIPATGRGAASPLGGLYLMYGASLSGTRLDQARTLGAALAQPAIQARIARELAWLPALRAALADPAVGASPALAAAAPQADDAPGLPPNKELRCAWDAIKATLLPVLLGELAQEQAGPQMQASATKCIAAP
jgi:arabinogalactan oligomer/maltooligosaccharide transport system substrate-binding protein